jgi:hypothetical protein
MPQRLRSTADNIRKYIDVGMLQEVRPDQLNLIQSAKPEDHMLGGEYGIFPKEDIAYGSQNPIVWRLTEFEFLDGQMIDGPQVTDTGVHNGSAVLVKLRHKETDRIVYAISEHAPVGDAPAHPGAPQARYDNAVNRANYVHQLQLDHPDAIILSGADWNSYYDAAPGDPQPTKDNNPQNTAYCLMVNSGGLVDSLDAFEHRADENLPDKCQPRDVHRVDHVFLSNRKWLTVTDYRYGGGELDAPANGSDVHGTLVGALKVEAAN